MERRRLVVRAAGKDIRERGRWRLSQSVSSPRSSGSRPWPDRDRPDSPSGPMVRPPAPRSRDAPGGASAADLPAHVRDTVADAPNGSPDGVRAHLRTPTGRVDRVDGGLRSRIQLAPRPPGRALERRRSMGDRGGGILAGLLLLLGCRVPGRGERVVGLGERFLQIVRRRHRPLLDVRAQSVEIVGRLLDVLRGLVHVALDERLVGAGHALVRLYLGGAGRLRVGRRDPGHQHDGDAYAPYREPSADHLRSSSGRGGTSQRRINIHRGGTTTLGLAREAVSLIRLVGRPRRDAHWSSANATPFTHALRLPKQQVLWLRHSAAHQRNPDQQTVQIVLTGDCPNPLVTPPDQQPIGFWGGESDYSRSLASSSSRSPLSGRLTMVTSEVKPRSGVGPVSRRQLGELDEHVARRSRIEEGDAGTAVADARRLIAELHPLRPEFSEGAVDVFHLEADVKEPGALLIDPSRHT